MSIYKLICFLFESQKLVKDVTKIRAEIEEKFFEPLTSTEKRQLTDIIPKLLDQKISD